MTRVFFDAGANLLAIGQQRQPLLAPLFPLSDIVSLISLFSDIFK
jgi:hypothetical protein